MRLVLCYPVEPKHVAQIRAVAPHLELVESDQQTIPELIHTADLFCGHAKVPVDWDRVVAQGRLRWTQSSAAGLDWLLVPSVIESPMIVTSASGVLGDQVAEHTVAILTAITRSLPVFFRAQQKKEYVRLPTRDVHHSTIGIVGFGGIGRRVAEVLAPFKTRILATDMFPVDKPAHVAELWPADRLDDMLALADIVVLCLPLNSQTMWLFDHERFARMKRGVIFLNMARGKLVVEEALVEALVRGHLYAAEHDDHAARGRSKRAAQRQHDQLFLRQPPPLPERRAAAQPRRQAAGLSDPRRKWLTLLWSATTCRRFGYQWAGPWT
jgi:phosphoglycerate dehydrogenase-like enzyme